MEKKLFKKFKLKKCYQNMSHKNAGLINSLGNVLIIKLKLKYQIYILTIKSQEANLF